MDSPPDKVDAVLGDSSTGKRKQYVIDSGWQLVNSGKVAALVVGFSAVYFVATYLLTTGSSLERMSARQIGLAAILINAAYFALLATGVFLTVIRLTHSVAGPAMVLENCVRAMSEGRFDERTSLRDGDYLSALGEAAEDLRVKLAEREADCADLGRELYEACERGDLDTSRAVARRLNKLALGNLECPGSDPSEQQAAA